MGLKLDRIELREINLDLKSPFETSFGRTSSRRVLIVRVFDRSGATGYGECTAKEGPFYSHETIDTSWLIIEKFVTSILEGNPIDTADQVAAKLLPIRGNEMAKSAVETAIWDLEAKVKGIPLWRHLGGTRNEIACGVSIGLQQTIAELLDKVALELSRGYQRIKIKIKPGQDIDLVSAIRSNHPTIRLSVDANSAYTLEDQNRLKLLDDFKLMMIEQPLSAGDLIDHAKLQQNLETPICLDESIVNRRDARQAISISACRIINIKLGRVGGHSEARVIQEYSLNQQIPVWCGGMLETGIGRAHNIAMSTQEGFSLPGDVSASARYWHQDIIEPAVTVTSRGTIEVPEAPGIGFEVDEERLNFLTVRRQAIRLG